MATNELIYRTRVVFKVHNCTDIKEDSVVSDHFVIGSDLWRVFCRIDGHCNGDGHQHYIGAYLQLVNTLEETIDATHTVSVLDSDYQPVKTVTTKRVAHRKTDNMGHGDRVVETKTLKDQMDKYMPNNTLTMAFNITVFKPSVGHLKRVNIGFGDKDLNDCRLVVQQKEFFASKFVLSCRSEVFRKMFTNNMSEKASNEVVIEDIDPKVFEEFLRFLHLGDSDKLQEMAEPLIYVSDKYMVDDLKIICMNLLYLQINNQNAFQVLEVLDKYRNTDLKTKAIEFIRDNWTIDMKSKDTLLDDILSHILISKLKKPTETMTFSYLV